MNELTSGESLQQILDRRERAAALTAAANVAATIVAWTLATALVVWLAAWALSIYFIAIGADSPLTNLDGFIAWP